MNLVDVSQQRCKLTASVSSVVSDEDLVNARASTKDQPETPVRQALLLLLDQIDYTSYACAPFDMVGACIPPEVLVICHKALQEG